MRMFREVPPLCIFREVPPLKVVEQLALRIRMPRTIQVVAEEVVDAVEEYAVILIGVVVVVMLVVAVVVVMLGGVVGADRVVGVGKVKVVNRV